MITTFGNKKFDQAYFTGKLSCGYEDGYTREAINGQYDCYSDFKKAAQYIHNLGVKDYLEIGCACGYLMEELLKYNIKVLGWDISSYIVEQASKEVKSFIEVKSIDKISTLPDESFDLVHISTVLGYMPLEKLDYYLREIKRVTRKYAVLYAGTCEDAPEEIPLRKINQPDAWWNERYAKFFNAKDLKWYLWEK